MRIIGSVPLICSVATLLLSTVAAGCGQSGEEGSQLTSGEDGQVEVHLSPSTPQAGDVVRVTVRNDTDSTIEYGLETNFQRQENGSWIDVSGSNHLLEKPKELTRAPTISVKSGTETSGYSSSLVDEFTVASVPSPGSYRVVKPFTSVATGAGGLAVSAAFSLGQ